MYIWCGSLLSALASQMYCAAQVSSQQQAMFEKLDITPKSAQKIKPVLERWIKEAEERYKSGQNHLTTSLASNRPRRGNDESLLHRKHWNYSMHTVKGTHIRQVQK
ncbi:pou domain motif 3 [Carabus blaptoides fortunei]